MNFTKTHWWQTPWKRHLFLVVVTLFLWLAHSVYLLAESAKDFYGELKSEW